MHVGSVVWAGDRAGVVLAHDENGTTVGYFDSVETHATPAAEEPATLSHSRVEKDDSESGSGWRR